MAIHRLMAVVECFGDGSASVYKLAQRKHPSVHRRSGRRLLPLAMGELESSSGVRPKAPVTTHTDYSDCAKSLQSKRRQLEGGRLLQAEEWIGPM
ncbi:hypothetical protein D3C78_1570840 [compost metagenome]